MELSGKKNLLLVKQTGLAPGVKGNMKTVDVMKQVAHERAGHPKIRKLTLNVLNHYGVKSHHYADEAKAVGDYVKRKVRYVKDPAGIEQLHDPLMLVDQIERGIARGDCDDMALLIASMLLSIGHRPKFRTVRYRTYTGGYNHIYVVDYAQNGPNGPYRIVLDAIIKDKPIGFEVPHKSGKEIPV